MPTYQYACTRAECGNEFELVQSFSDPSANECPACHGPVRKVFSAVGVVFKGSGFYRTDSRSDSSGSHKESSGKESSGNGTKAASESSSGGSSSDNGSSSASTASSESSTNSTSSSSTASESKPKSKATTSS